LRDLYASLAGDRTFTNKLNNYKAPLYVIGTGHGVGKYMKDNIKLFGSSSITWNYIANFGHIDHYASPYHRQILEYPVLLWLNKVFSSYKYKSDEEPDVNEIPISYDTKPKVYPNPASTVVMVSYELPKDSKVNLFITDISGRKVLDLLSDEKQVAGKYELPFDVSSLISGTYFYKLQINDAINTGQLKIIK